MPVFVRRIKRTQEVTQYFDLDRVGDVQYIDAGKGKTPAREIYHVPQMEIIAPAEEVKGRELELFRGSNFQKVTRDGDD